MQIFEYIKKVFLPIVLFGYISIAVFGIWHIVHMSDTQMSMEHCPFSFGGHSLCAMDAVAHIKAWQELSSVSISSIEFLMYLLTVVSIFVLYTRANQHTSRFLAFFRREKLIILSLYQHLFSQGILNPKIH